MQSKIAPEMQGRVMGLTNSICAMMMPLALLIAAPVAEFVSLQLWYWLGGTLTMLIAGGAFLIPAIMTLDKQKHETIPQPAMQA